MKKLTVLLVAVALAVCVAPASSSVWAAEKPVLMMATTTSTDDTGLLDYLKPIYEADTGMELRWVAVGTGKALEHGRNGDVDVLLVHAPASEKEFVKEGWGVDRRQVMYNDFVVIGPKDDPAGVKGKSVPEGFKAIADKKAPFVSRGDDSGTHKKEQSLWKAAGMAVPDKDEWYVSVGQGMMTTIMTAQEKNGYTMTDRGTYIKYESQNKGNPALVILMEGDPNLINQYSVIMVNPEKHPNTKTELGKKFLDWWVSPKAQQAIADFKLEGKQLFFPNAGK